tara:strand:+ start:1388 stop:2017 length:630 start_codon:yes stop_codon:yes gene_type:complete
MGNKKIEICFSDLLSKYITDKNHGTVKNIYNNLDDRVIIDNAKTPIGHTYGESYQEIFETFDRESKLNFLEIGIQRGGGLMASRDYFPNANIYGVDIVDVVLPEYRRDDITFIFKDIRDTSVKEQLRDVKFDIIIDDGSHHLPDVLFVVNNFLDTLSHNGVLVIEDVQDFRRWPTIIKDILPGGYTITSKDLRAGHGYDNCLIIITRDI